MCPAQLESIVYACQRHERMLPDNQRAGFFIGDGAGVGKGRTIAGATALYIVSRLAARRDSRAHVEFGEADDEPTCSMALPAQV